MTVYGCTVRSTLTGCQVTSLPRDRFSRYSKWLDTFRTALVCIYRYIHTLQLCIIDLTQRGCHTLRSYSDVMFLRKYATFSAGIIPQTPQLKGSVLFFLGCSEVLIGNGTGRFGGGGSTASMFGVKMPKNGDCICTVHVVRSLNC